MVWERQKEETGWRSWVPWPHVHADDVLPGNPPDIPEITMVPRVEAPLALLIKPSIYPWIKLQQPDARLIRRSDTPPSDWSFRLDTILFDRGRIAIDDSVTRADIDILVDPLGKPLPFFHHRRVDVLPVPED